MAGDLSTISTAKWSYPELQLEPHVGNFFRSFAALAALGHLLDRLDLNLEIFGAVFIVSGDASKIQSLTPSRMSSE